ncbi:hypothetical protein BY458DRAFT_433617 [Sporodiniella umbellata]|nr:hypothetical protein BY458DRAFT_433617 [Sporodiniella umbellata]
MTRLFNHQDSADECEETFHTNMQKKKPMNRNYKTIFSDDEDEPPQKTLPKLISGYTDPVLSTTTYHIHQADNALSSLKQIALEEEGWKKTLKHKSGVVVHMKNGMHSGDKTPIFKGEAVIQGFSPQAIFYVIGMRKLWDDQYEDGSLIENLNDTTSLTYEVTKSTTTSKSRDLALVEKIECTQNGVIIFACTSIESPKIPRISGRTRTNIKLQGWILEPLRSSPQPATKVVFVVQESIKGWVPSFTKKSLARRPLAIAKIEEYLEKKADRMRPQTHQTTRSGLSKRPSVMNLHSKVTHVLPPPPPPPRHYDNKSPLSLSSTSTLRPSPEPKQGSLLFTSSPSPPQSTSMPPTEEPTRPLPSPPRPTHKSLYPFHSHPIQKVEGVQLLKKLTSSYDYWTLYKQIEDTKFYTFKAALENEMSRKLSFIRLDGIIRGAWTPEQLCSVIHCTGSRKIWDPHFEQGEIIERFSQKDYLVRWQFGGSMDLADTDISAITTIETEPGTNAVYTTAVSVFDTRVPPDPAESRIRAHTDLYGWMFCPQTNERGEIVSIETRFVCNMDFKYAVPKPVLKNWWESVMSTLASLQAYLDRYGYPPYIRRVAGKVITENFDAKTSRYHLSYVVKHEPSRSYRTRKGQDVVWCTVIRFQQAMFPHGLDIQIVPKQYIRADINMKQQTVRVFTTHESTDGQQISISFCPLQDPTMDSMAYSYNRVLTASVKQVEKTPNTESTKPKEAQVVSAPDESLHVPKGYLLVPESQVRK